MYLFYSTWYFCIYFDEYLNRYGTDNKSKKKGNANTFANIEKNQNNRSKEILE